MSQYPLQTNLWPKFITSVDNTALKLGLVNPVNYEQSYLNVTGKPDSDYWSIGKSIDGSYYINNGKNNAQYMHLEGGRLTSGTRAEMWIFSDDSYYHPHYRWTIKQAAPYSSNYLISPVLNNTLSLSSGETTKVGNEPKSVY